MIIVTKNQFEILERIQIAFSDTLIKEHFNGDKCAANAAFASKLGFIEKCSFLLVKMRYDMSLDTADYETRTKLLVNYCNMSLPILIQILGEETVINAFPDEALNMDIVVLLERLKANNIANIIRKSL